jgi:hypothetical protein
MKSVPQEQPYRRPLGFFEALLASRRLREYYDLIMLENFSYLHDMDERARLEKDYPQYFKKGGSSPEHHKLRKEISRLTVVVHKSLRRINAPTDWREDSEELEYDYEKHKNVKNRTTEEFDVILDRQYPVYKNKKGFKDTETTYPMLEQSIAVYDSVWKNYWMKIINPLWLIGFILRLPISLMEHMGMNTGSVNINKFVYWLIQVIVLLIISFLALKLGIPVNIPWPK